MVALPISDFDTTSIQQVTLTPAGYYRLYGDAPEPLKVVHPSDPMAASIAVLIDRWDWRQDWIGKHYRRPIIIPFVRIPSTLYILPAPKPAPKPTDDFDEQSPAAAYRGIKRTVIQRISTVIPEQSFTLFEEDVKAGLVGVRFDDILTGPQAHKIRRAGIAFTEISEGRHTAVVKLATLPIVEPVAVKVAPKSEPLPCDVPAMPIQSPLVDGYWLSARDGDKRALALYNRHYSAYDYKDGRERKLFVGPGEKMVLMTVSCDALFVWRKFIDDSGQTGVNCAVFRNESRILSSTLIKEAVEMAWQRWPGERLYTYVDAGKVASRNPGYCFKMAGWLLCGKTQSGKLVLELTPPAAPAVEVKALYAWPRDLSAGDVIHDGSQEYTITYVRQPDAGKRCGSIAVRYADGGRGLVSVDWQPMTLSNMVIVGGPKMDAARTNKAIIERRPAAGFYVYKGLKGE